MISKENFRKFLEAKYGVEAVEEQNMVERFYPIEKQFKEDTFMAHLKEDLKKYTRKGIEDVVIPLEPPSVKEEKE